MFSSNNANDATRKNWQPNPVEVQKLTTEIEALYDKNTKSLFDEPSVKVQSKRPEPLFIEECAKVSAFLMDEQAVMNQLERLNTILVDKIKNGAKADSVYLLRHTIEEELAKLGFHPNLAKPVQIVQASIFRAAITHGLLLKDAALGKLDHGEFTHALQWLAIAWQQQDSNFLGRPAVDVFKELGEEKSVYYRMALDPRLSKTTPRPESSLWDFVIDEAKDTVKFRSPEVLHVHLLKLNENESTPLVSLLKQRSKKRKEEINYEKYSLKKLSKPSVFDRKDKREPYEHSPDKLSRILTPTNIKIDMDSFNERSSKQKNKK